MPGRSTPLRLACDFVSRDSTSIPTISFGPARKGADFEVRIEDSAGQIFGFWGMREGDGKGLEGDEREKRSVSVRKFRSEA